MSNAEYSAAHRADPTQWPLIPVARCIACGAVIAAKDVVRHLEVSHKNREIYLSVYCVKVPENL